MAFQPLRDIDAHRVNAPATAIVLFIVAVIFIPYALQRLWPIDRYIANFGRTEQYAWLECLLALSIYYLLVGATEAHSEFLRRPRPTASPLLRSALAIGLAILLCNFVLAGIGLLLQSLSADLIGPGTAGQPALQIRLKSLELAGLGLGTWLTLGAQVVLTPITEELLFRGLLLRKLLGRWPSAAAIVLSSVYFAAAHIDANPAHAFLAGLIFGIVYQRTGCLRIAIAGHAIANCLALGFNASIALQPQRPTSEWQSVAVLVTTFLLALAVLALVRVACRQRQPQ